MKIRVDYKNRDLEVISTAHYDLDVYCANLSQRLIGILSSIELLFDINTLKENKSYLRLRHMLLDVSGEIKRLPDNLIVEPDDYCNLEVKKNEKLTMGLIQRLFGKVGD